MAGLWASIIILLAVPIVTTAQNCTSASTTTFTNCVMQMGTSEVITRMASRSGNNSQEVGNTALATFANSLDILCTENNAFIESLKCMKNVLQICKDDNPLFDMYDYFWNIQGWIDAITEMCNNRALIDNTKNCYDSKSAEITQCVENKLNLQTQQVTLNLNNITAMKWTVCRMYEAGSDCYDTMASCSQELTALSKKTMLQMTPNHCKTDFTAVARCTVGVYGDPHIRVCDQFSLQTCRAVGERVYLKNDVFELKGTAVEISVNFSPAPTAIKSVKIDFKTIDGKTAIGSYVANNGQLPKVFGSNWAELGSGYSLVTISEGLRSNEVKIRYGGIGMILLIRNVGNYYFFTLRWAQTSIQKSYGLLAEGCPPSESISRLNFIGRRKRAASNAAMTACSGVSDANMQEMCQYDVSVSGDTQFATMTLEAEETITNAGSMDAEMIKNAKSPTDGDNNGVGSSHSYSPVFGIILVAMTCILNC